MADNNDIASLELQSEALGDSLGDAAGMAASFESELRRVRDAFEATGKDVETLERGLSKGLRRAFEGVVFDGQSLSSALDTLARSLVNTTYNAAIKPVTDQVGGLISSGVGDLIGSLLPFANGAAFSQGRVMPFARGGVVSSPTSFPMRGGTGLMGEAGPEAILPLSRGADGSLGVRSQGGGTVNLVMNVTTPDVQGFARSRGQIAAQMSRALSRGNRNR
ncbi:phage tail tape measure protein, lambda family [Phaeobacter sp. CECT 5382]|uniref:phage tail tape measure protein n=1 Tax=Rhodobacterales TaxID=204455 RepID=UPI0006DA8384|nr:phage tail tape measure protein [Phaeobacter sp. CECT 5382]CUH87451.1 phage tail tape measure protein, lambda family [Phaeobacter sp. CECT 5382]